MRVSKNNERREEMVYIFRIDFLCIESYLMNSNDSNYYFISSISRITDPNAQQSTQELGP